LAVAAKIVEQHGGDILVKSSPGEGTEFTVKLPAASVAPAVGRV
jgi:signal transduction histidine kinase